MTELTNLKKQLAELKARIDAFEQGVAADFDKVTVDGVEYYDTKEELSHQECLDLASKHGLRILERWELCKLYDESKSFRNSLSPKWHWSASVNSYSRDYAWRFYGGNGYVYYDYRYDTNGARCVVK